MAAPVKKLILVLIVWLLFVHPVHAQDEQNFAPGTKVIVTVGILPVHIKPDANSPIAGEIIAGTVTTVLQTHTEQQSSAWLYVTTSGFGWIENKANVRQYSPEELGKFIDEQSALIKENNQNVEALRTRGNAYSYQNNYRAALADFDAAIKLTSEDSRLFEFRANVYLGDPNTTDSTQTIKDLNEAIRLNRKFPSTYNRLGIAYQDDNALDFAENYFKQAIALLPEWGIPYSNLGTLYRIQKDYTKAINQYSEAVKYDPNLSVGYRNRGNTYKLISNYSKFLDDLNRAVEIDPSCDACYIDLGIYYADDLGDHETGIEQFTKAIQANPARARGYANRGSSYVMTGQEDLALADMQKAVALDPNDSFIQYAIGGLYTHLAMYQEAIDAYTASMNLGTHWGTSAYLYRPHDFIALGNYDNALTDISSWIAGIDLSVDRSDFVAYAYMLRGAIHMYRGEYAEAKKDYQQAYQTYPEFLKTYGSRGSGYWGSLRREAALTTLEQQILSEPEDAKAYLQLAHQYMEYGHWDKAVEYYNKYMKLSPDAQLKDIVDYIVTITSTP